MPSIASAMRGRRAGMILADTKFEFGTDAAGRCSSSTRSSRPTPRATGRRTAMQPGRSPPSYDKQFVRDHLLGLHGTRSRRAAPAKGRHPPNAGEVPRGAEKSAGVVIGAGARRMGCIKACRARKSDPEVRPKAGARPATKERLGGSAMSAGAGSPGFLRGLTVFALRIRLRDSAPHPDAPTRSASPRWRVRPIARRPAPARGAASRARR